MSPESANSGEDQAQQLADAVVRGEMTRQDFLSRAAVLGISLSVAGSFLAGAERAAAAPKATAAVLRIGEVGKGAADTLNPHKQSTPMDGMRITSLYDKLFVNDSNYNPRPWLAREVAGSKDSKTWTIRIRDSEFHDGSKVTADDVKFTVEQILDPAVAARANALFVNFMKGATMTVVDPVTIRFNLAQPYPDLPAAFGDAGVNILSRKSFTDAKADSAPNGNGPFKFVSFAPGRESVMVKNPNYWNTKYPMVDELHLINIPDSNARANALLGGQIDLMTNVTYSLIPALQNKVKLFNIKGNNLTPIVVTPDVGNTPFKDHRVREALALSIDRPQILKIAYRGFGRIASDQPISNAYPYAPVGIKPRKQNIARAKQLLAAAGHKSVSATLITTDAYVGAVEIATLVAQQAKAAGFNLKIQKWSGDTYFDEVWLKKPFYMSGWTQRAVPELFLSTTSYTNSIWNESHFKSKKVDRLLTAARIESNRKKRTQLYTQAMKLVHESCTWLFPVYGNLIHASAKNFSWETMPPSTSGPYTHNMRLS